MQEIWKDIEGYNGAYQVSNLGRVKSFRRSKPRILLGSPNGEGYIYITFRVDSNRKDLRIHRLVAKAFCNGYKEGLQVDHINGIKADNRAINLRWVTNRQNSEGYKSNRSKYGCGVQKRCGRFWSYITVNQKQVYLGTYDTPKQAQQARTDFKTKHNLK